MNSMHVSSRNGLFVLSRSASVWLSRCFCRVLRGELLLDLCCDSSNVHFVELSGFARLAGFVGEAAAWRTANSTNRRPRVLSSALRRTQRAACRGVGGLDRLTKVVLSQDDRETAFVQDGAEPLDYKEQIPLHQSDRDSFDNRTQHAESGCLASASSRRRLSCSALIAASACVRCFFG